MLAIHSHWEC